MAIKASRLDICSPTVSLTAVQLPLTDWREGDLIQTEEVAGLTRSAQRS